MNIFSGSFVALVTPFADGRIDEPALRRMVDWHVGQGSHGLVPVGTTGESPTLDAEEHRRVVEIVVEQTAGRIPVMAGAGSNNTREALEFDRHAAERGADASAIAYNAAGGTGCISVTANVAPELCSADCRLPMVELAEPTRRRIRDAMASAGLL